MKRNSIFNEEEVKRYKKTVEEYDKAYQEWETKTDEIDKKIVELEAEREKIKHPQNGALVEKMKRHLEFVPYAEKINEAFVSGSQVMVSADFHQGYARNYLVDGDRSVSEGEADLIDPEWRKIIKDNKGYKVIEVDTSTIVWADDFLELTAKVGRQRRSFLSKDIVGDIRGSNRGVCFVYDFKK